MSEDSKKSLNADFGLALGLMQMTVDGCRDFASAGEFTSVELPVELFLPENAAILKSFKRGGYEKISCGSLMDAELSSEIPFSEKNNYVNDFMVQAEKMLLLACEGGAASATLAFPMEKVLASESACKTACEVVRRLARVLHEYGRKLVIPYRIPCRSELVKPELMMKFLRDCLTPSVRVRLDVHPHELARGADVSAMSGRLWMDIDSVVFIYDADSGNRLLKNHVASWLDYAEKAMEKVSFYACPESRRQRMALPEADSFAGLVKTLRAN